MDKETTFGMSPEGLASLLGIGIGGKKKPDVDQLAGELLAARLAGTMPLDTAVVDALPAIIGRLEKELVPFSGKSLSHVLLDAATDLPTIRKIKDHGKKLAGRKDSGAEHAVGLAIYYAAIASALLFHGAKITEHSLGNLVDAFETLRDKRWMPAELSRHFAKAIGQCRA